jgi:hypothetical protein
MRGAPAQPLHSCSRLQVPPLAMHTYYLALARSVLGSLSARSSGDPPPPRTSSSLFLSLSAYPPPLRPLAVSSSCL